MTLSHLLHRRRWARLDGRTERGAVLVELAMVVPILVVLIMGIVDYAVLFNQKIGIRGGVREAAWNGSRGIFGAAPNSSCSLTFPAALPDDNTQRIMCMVKRRSGLDQSELRVMVRVVDLDNPANPATYANGKGLMGGYGGNITLRDRWAIVAYIRSLQLAAKEAGVTLQ